MSMNIEAEICDLKRRVSELEGLLGRPTKTDISCVFDLVTSGRPTRIARDKDQLIGEAVWKEHLRKTGRLPKRQVRTKKNRA